MGTQREGEQQNVSVAAAVCIWANAAADDDDDDDDEKEARSSRRVDGNAWKEICIFG